MGEERNNNFFVHTLSSSHRSDPFTVELESLVPPLSDPFTVESVRLVSLPVSVLDAVVEEPVVPDVLVPVVELCSTLQSKECQI